MPIVTLTSDFGTADGYVAQMKGVLLSLGPPGLSLVDLSHELAPQDVRAGALLLGAAVPRFPPETVHLAVIDPGVGSARRALVVRAREQWVVAPDNGLCTRLLDAHGGSWALDVARVAGPAPSSTFHGRDVFAPAAARLAAGEAPERFADAIDDPVRLSWPAPTRSGHVTHGEVIHVDRFGNLITNVEGADLRVDARVWLGQRAVGAVRDHYAEVEPGALLALVGSSGTLEVSQRDGSAASATGAGVGSAVRVEHAEDP